MWSKFLITDGTKAGTIDLLPRLKEWAFSMPQTKGGGYWSGSTYTQGRQLFDKQLDNILDTFILDIFTGKQVTTIQWLNTLTTLLDKAVGYWTNDWQTEMVWIEICPEYQDNSQYAIIMDWNIPGLDEIFTAPFAFSGGMEDVNLIIEHGIWLETAPGTATALEIQSGNSLIAETTSDLSVWVSGYWSDYPLTHIFVYDAAPVTWTNITGLSGVNLFPAVPAAGDILYVGLLDTAPGIESGHFDNIVFNIGTAQAGLTIVAEYSRGGGAWGALPIAGYAYQDQTNTFQNTGRNIIVFDPVGGLNAWNSDVVNGVTAFWVRFRITVAAAPVCPTQVTDAIYTNQWPYFDIDDSDLVPGTYSAKAKIKLLGQDRTEGYPAGAVLPTGTDLIFGLRSLDRGDDFCAFLNATNTAALPTGVTWNFDAGVSQLDRYSPTLYITLWGPGGALARPGARIGYWEISIPQAYEYVGAYRAFLRVSCFGTDFWFRVGISHGSATTTPQHFTDWKIVSTTANTRLQETLDLGIINISQPVSVQDDYSVFLSVWGAHEAAAAVASYVYDLVLIPIDECAYQASLPSGTGILDALWTDKYLMVDSISDPKLEASAELYGSPFSSSPFQNFWQCRTPGEIIWQHNKTQRLWILSMNEQNISTGGNGEFLSMYHIAQAAQAWKQSRYIALRGDE